MIAGCFHHHGEQPVPLRVTEIKPWWCHHFRVYWATILGAGVTDEECKTASHYLHQCRPSKAASKIWQRLAATDTGHQSVPFRIVYCNTFCLSLLYYGRNAKCYSRAQLPRSIKKCPPSPCKEMVPGNSTLPMAADWPAAWPVMRSEAASLDSVAPGLGGSHRRRAVDPPKYFSTLLLPRYYSTACSSAALVGSFGISAPAMPNGHYSRLYGCSLTAHQVASDSTINPVNCQHSCDQLALVRWSPVGAP